MFEQDYNQLNDRQKQVVEGYNKNLLVLAPAGTGKTKVIAMRCVRLIKAQILPSEILCLTFTNKAAKEMKERIALYMPQEVQQMTIKTFHSFCFHLISHEKEASHFSFPCTILDEADSEEIIRQIIKRNGLDEAALYYPAILGFFENIKRYSLSFPSEERYQYSRIVQDYFSQEKPEHSETGEFIRKYGLRLLNTYMRYLRENNSIDFMDLVVEAKYLLEQPRILNKWQAVYKVIQIDEMQDTSCREYDLLKSLGEKAQLSMFGDFNQTIYEWRGSNPMGMTESYKTDFKPELITLSTNYRSTQVLLEAANGYIASSKLYPVHCQTASEVLGEPIFLLEASDKEDEMKRLAASVKERMQLGKRIAVLTRTNIYAKAISRVFDKAHIPCTVIEDTKFFRKKVVKQILAYFEYSLNSRNGYALQKILECPYIGMPNWLLVELKKTKESYLFLHDWFKEGCQDPYKKLYEAYKHNKIVVLDVESTGLSTTTDDIVQIAAIQYGEAGVQNTLDVLLKPTQKVGYSFYVHGFSDEELAQKGQEPVVALSTLLDFVQDCIIVGHNIQFDLQIISSMLERYSLPSLPKCSIYDTLDLATKVYPKLANHKLSTLSALIQTQAQPNHNALYDILATSEVLTHLLMKIMENQGERLQYIESYFSYIEEYKQNILHITNYLEAHPLYEGINYLVKTYDLGSYYSESEMQDLRALYRIAKAFYEPQRSLLDSHIEFLTFASLHYSEIEQSEFFKGKIPIITIHQAKGLEFDEVYIAGCNEGVFPSYRSIKDGKLTEEKRLFYVAMTRAKKRLTLSYHLQGKKSVLVEQISKRYKHIQR